jgi:hypothetical protein
MVALMSTAPSTTQVDGADYANAHVERIQGQTLAEPPRERGSFKGETCA